jgi:excisionase family DNA binding protein
MSALDADAAGGIMGPEARMANRRKNKAAASGFLDVPAVAVRLGCIDRWVRFLLKSGELKGTRLGRQWVIKEVDVADYERRLDEKRKAEEEARRLKNREDTRRLKLIARAR